MDQYLSWFANASPAAACDFILKGVSELRTRFKNEEQLHNRTRQQLEIAYAAGRIPQADKPRLDAEMAAVEKQATLNTKYDDVLIVMSVLGSRIVGLGAVNHETIISASVSVRQAFASIPESRYFERYEKMDRSVQIGIICGMTFCVECYPMHMWRGFGAGVRSEPEWGRWVQLPEGPYPDPDNAWQRMDQSIAFLKSMPRSVTLLKKAPEGLERIRPSTRQKEKEDDPRRWKEGKKDRKALEKSKEDFNKRVQKKGFPQPLDNSLKITSWSLLYGTWDSDFIVSNEGHSWTNILRQQPDPGRLLYGYVAGGHLNLREGECVIAPAGPAECLIRWLEGLDGMTFKLLDDSDLNFKKLGLKSSTKKSKKNLGIRDAYAVRDELAVQRRERQLVESNANAAPPPPPTDIPPAPKMPVAFPPMPNMPGQLPNAGTGPQYASNEAPPPPRYSTFTLPSSPPPQPTFQASINPTRADLFVSPDGNAHNSYDAGMGAAKGSEGPGSSANFRQGDSIPEMPSYPEEVEPEDSQTSQGTPDVNTTQTPHYPHTQTPSPVNHAAQYPNMQATPMSQQSATIPPMPSFASSSGYHSQGQAPPGSFNPNAAPTSPIYHDSSPPGGEHHSPVDGRQTPQTYDVHAAQQFTGTSQSTYPSYSQPTPQPKNIFQYPNSLNHGYVQQPPQSNTIPNQPYPEHTQQPESTQYPPAQYTSPVIPPSSQYGSVPPMPPMLSSANGQSQVQPQGPGVPSYPSSPTPQPVSPVPTYPFDPRASMQWTNGAASPMGSPVQDRRASHMSYQTSIRRREVSTGTAVSAGGGN